MSGRNGGRDRRATSSGQALVELALVLPILVVLLLGSVDVGRMIFAYIALEEAVQEGAAYATAMAPTDANTRYTKVRWRVINSSTHPEVAGAAMNLSDVNCYPQSDPVRPGLITVSASYALPLITPVGEAIFGGSYTMRVTVTSTNIRATCT